MRSEADSDGDGKLDVTVEYADGKKTRQREDRNGDGKPDVVTSFDADEKPARIEEDSDGDGRLDTRHLLRGAARRAAPRATATATASPTSSRTTRAARSCARKRTRTSTAAIDKRTQAGREGHADPGSGLERRRQDRHLDHHRRATARCSSGEEDRSGDGKPDLTAWFKNGKRERLEQDTRRPRLHRPEAVASTRRSR